MANVSSSNGLEKRPALSFRDDCGREFPSWHRTTLGTIIEPYSEKVHGEHDFEVLTSSREGLQRQIDHFGSQQRHDTDGYNIIPLGFCTYRNRSDDGRFTFNINKISDKAIVSKFYPVFRFKNANSTFMTEYLNSSARARKKLSVLAVGTSQVVLSFEALKSAKFDLPCKEEQDKIASLLECLNERVELQRSFVDALKKYKRGLLSNLFGEKITQGCTTKSYYFSEIAQRRSEKYDPTSGIEYPCVELENIEQETGKILSTVPSTAQSSIKNIAKSGDTLFGKLRPYLRKYAFAQKTMACSSEIWALIPSDAVLPKFLFYLVQTEQFLRVANISSGTKMPRAEWSNIEKTEFFIPDPFVQRKVVSLLEGLDQKITFADSALFSLNRLKAKSLGGF